MEISKKLAQKLFVMNDLDLGKRIKQKRRENLITQVELAKKMNVSQAEICNIERGKKRVIAVWPIADALGVNPSFLVSE